MLQCALFVEFFLLLQLAFSICAILAILVHFLYMSTTIYFAYVELVGPTFINWNGTDEE